MQGGYPPAGSYPPDPNVPQPPDAQTQQQNPQPQQPVTLGQANGDPSGLPPGNPILDQYNQAIASTLAMMKQQGIVRDTVPPQPGPGILESLGTFGMANLKHIADENTRREENYKILQQNRAVALKGVDLATKMVDSQVVGGTANQRLQIAIQNQGLQIAKFLNDEQNRLHTDARNQVKDNFDQNTIPTPLTEDAQNHARDLGYVPSTRFRNRWELPDTGDGGGGGAGGGGTGGARLYRQADGSWGTKPGAPANTVLNAVGGGDTGGGAAGGGPAPLVKRPGESYVDFAARKKQADTIQTKLAVPTSSSRTMSEMAPKVLTLADQVEQSMKRIKAGPLSSRAQEFSAGTLGVGNAPFTKYRTDVGLLQTSLMRMHVGARGGEQMMQHFKSLLDAGKQSPENMQAALDEIRDYAKSMLPKDAATTDTPTSGGGPPSTVGGGTKPTAATGLTPGGIRFREVQ